MKKNLLGFAIALFLLAGCAIDSVDWNARIGTYTYDQAIDDMGRPDKQFKTGDGRLVAEWISRYSDGTSMPMSNGYGPAPGGPGYTGNPGPGYYEDTLRLTFSTNNILEAWSKQ